MSILNYTTEVSTGKTVAEIMDKLVKAKAQAVLTEYESDGTVSAISFRLATEFGVLSFRLPANIQKVYQVIIRDPGITRKQRTRDQAARIAWRIVKDWLEAQLAMIEAGLVDLEQVFLPYVQAPSGQTLYELMREQKFRALLPPGEKDAQI